MRKNMRRARARVTRIENADMFNTASLAATRGERGTMPFGFSGAVGLWKIVFELEDGSEHEIIVKGRKSRMFAVDEKGILLYDDRNHYRWMPEE